MIFYTTITRKKSNMTDYELEQFCIRNTDCGCDCMACPAFAANQREELGLDEHDASEDDDYERYSLEMEIAETACDCNIGF